MADEERPRAELLAEIEELRAEVESLRAHGGTVRAESEGTGSGSRFIVTLPGQLDGHAHPSR